MMVQKSVDKGNKNIDPEGWELSEIQDSFQLLCGCTASKTKTTTPKMTSETTSAIIGGFGVQKTPQNIPSLTKNTPINALLSPICQQESGIFWHNNMTATTTTLETKLPTHLMDKSQAFIHQRISMKSPRYPRLTRQSRDTNFVSTEQWKRSNTWTRLMAKKKKTRWSPWIHQHVTKWDHRGFCHRFNQGVANKCKEKMK